MSDLAGMVKPYWFNVDYRMISGDYQVAQGKVKRGNRWGGGGG